MKSDDKSELFLFLNSFDTREKVDSSFSYYKKLRRADAAKQYGIKIEDAMRSNRKTFKSEFSEILFAMGPYLFELENLAYLTEFYTNPESKNYINAAIKLVTQRLHLALLRVTKALQTAPKNTLKSFDRIFNYPKLPQDMKDRARRLQNFILIMMTEVLKDHKSTAFIQIKRQLVATSTNIFQHNINPHVLFCLRNENSPFF
ncbi:hypothetical protein HMI56_006504 [Coelomomyces lativittatus]|nr:hypothetical protein HMI56_006504 [Coelomomyces lativittatus]